MQPQPQLVTPRPQPDPSPLRTPSPLPRSQLVNEKPSVIQEYETGKAIPNPQVLSKLSRVLGVTLKKNPGK
jgi:hypothetical protein